MKKLEDWALNGFLTGQFAQVDERLSSTKRISAKTRLIWAVCMRRLNKNRQSLDQFERLHSTSMGELAESNQLDVYDGLAACYWALNDLAKASHFGREAILARKRHFKKAPIDWIKPQVPKQLLSTVGTSAQGKKVIAYSLYGNLPVYCEMLLFTAATVPFFYPGWEVWVYHDDTVPAHVLGRLKASGAMLKSTQDANKKYQGTMWRFLAIEDPSVDWVMLRDADSLITQREQRCVQAWLQSGKSAHVIRDWYSHTELMLAGMTGLYAPKYRGITTALDDFVNKPFTPTHGDQHFLRSYVWPYASDDVCEHDSCFGGDAEKAVFQAPPTLAAHIGNCLSSYIRVNYPDGYTDTKVQKYIGFFSEQTLVCEYPLTQHAPDGSKAWVIELPNLLCDMMNAGKLHIKLR